MLAGLNSNGITNIIEENQSRDHTENMLQQSPNVLKIKKNKKKQNQIKVIGKNYLNPLKINVGGDPSSAAFFTALTLLTPRAKLKIKHVGLNPRRIGFYNLLKKHGAKIKFSNIKKIPQYPMRRHFHNLVENFQNINEIKKNWILSQEKMNLDNEIKFLKTHQVSLCFLLRNQ
jgi:3-phosphoshikimate 1-carboxyvinyltransferase